MKLSLCFLAAVASVFPQDLRLPNRNDSIRFAVIGDSGTGERPQYETAEQLALWRDAFPFEFVIMMGDNLYGSEKPKDYEKKFERPYAALLQAGVQFYASLGNHDDLNQRFYLDFNMRGERFYTFSPREDVAFFALDSTYMGRAQLDWLRTALPQSTARWKIAFFHHPLYSSGKRHGPDVELREYVEPIFREYDVSVVFNGHEHFYERLEPQNGIFYFIVGASGKLRRGNVRPTAQTAAYFDQDRSFLLVEITSSAIHFQAVSRTGETVDSGTISPAPEDVRSASVELGQAEPAIAELGGRTK